MEPHTALKKRSGAGAEMLTPVVKAVGPVIVSLAALPIILIFLRAIGQIELVKSWPSGVFLLVAIFVYPLFMVLKGLAGMLGRASSVEVCGIKWSAIELDEALAEREELRAKILIVYSGIQDSTDEFRALVNSVSSPDYRTRRLPTERRREVLASSFKLAAADDIITRSELEALRNISRALDLGGKDFYEAYSEYRESYSYITFKGSVTREGDFIWQT